MASRVVYTAITGGHARLSGHPRCPDTDFVCYSDVPLDRDDWEVRSIVAASHLSPRLRAKFHKLFPPEGYAWNVWVDGAYILRTDEGASGLVDDLVAHSQSGFGLHAHMRDCLFDEAEHSMTLDKCRFQREIIEAQARHYEHLGHPRHWGLWAGGLLCRDGGSRVAEVMQQWWDEMQRWSWRDQISLPFVLRSLGVRPDTWPWPLFKNPFTVDWIWNACDESVAP